MEYMNSNPSIPRKNKIVFLFHFLTLIENPEKFIKNFFFWLLITVYLRPLLFGVDHS